MNFFLESGLHNLSEHFRPSLRHSARAKEQRISQLHSRFAHLFEGLCESHKAFAGPGTGNGTCSPRVFEAMGGWNIPGLAGMLLVIKFYTITTFYLIACHVLLLEYFVKKYILRITKTLFLLKISNPGY